jgi:hypothetical protein
MSSRRSRGWAVALHEPVFEKKPSGQSGVLIRFEKSRRTISKHRIVDSAMLAVLEGGGGTLLPVPGTSEDRVSRNAKNPSIITMAREMTRGGQGTTTYRYDMIRDKRVTTEVKHAVYLPINVVNTYWSIVVATPDREVVGAVARFRTRLLVIFGILIIFGIPSSYYGARAGGSWRRGKRKEAEASIRKSEECYRNSLTPPVTALSSSLRTWPS